MDIYGYLMLFFGGGCFLQVANYRLLHVVWYLRMVSHPSQSGTLR